MDKRTCGIWGLEFDGIKGPNQPDYPEREYTMENNYSNLVFQTRTDPTLINEIKKIGVKCSGETIYSKNYLLKVPAKLIPFISLVERDGYESASYNCQVAMRIVVNDDTISDNERRQRLIELDFLGILFNIFVRDSYK